MAFWKFPSTGGQRPASLGVLCVDAPPAPHPPPSHQAGPVVLSKALWVQGHCGPYFVSSQEGALPPCGSGHDDEWRTADPWPHGQRARHAPTPGSMAGAWPGTGRLALARHIGPSEGAGQGSTPLLGSPAAAFPLKQSIASPEIREHAESQAHHFRNIRLCHKRSLPPCALPAAATC